MREEDILPFVTTLMDLEHIMLRRPQKTSTRGCHLHVESKKSQLIKIESKMVIIEDRTHVV